MPARAPNAARIRVQTGPNEFVAACAAPLFDAPDSLEAVCLLNGLKLVAATDDASAAGIAKALGERPDVVVVSFEVLAAVNSLEGVPDAAAMAKCLSEVKDLRVMAGCASSLAGFGARGGAVTSFSSDALARLRSRPVADLLNERVQIPDGACQGATARTLLLPAIAVDADADALVEACCGAGRVGAGAGSIMAFLEFGVLHQFPALRAMKAGLASRGSSAGAMVRCMRAFAAVTAAEVGDAESIRALVLEFEERALLDTPLCDAFTSGLLASGFAWIAVSLVDLGLCSLSMVSRLPAMGGRDGTEHALSLSTLAAAVSWLVEARPQVDDPAFAANVANALDLESTHTYPARFVEFVCGNAVREQINRLLADESLPCAQAEPFHLAQQRTHGFAAALKQTKRVLLGAVQARINSVISDVREAKCVLPVSERDPVVLLRVPSTRAQAIVEKLKAAIAQVPPELGHPSETMYALAAVGEGGKPLSAVLRALRDAHGSQVPLVAAPAPAAGTLTSPSDGTGGG